jgi:hypothetical protein
MAFHHGAAVDEKLGAIKLYFITFITNLMVSIFLMGPFLGLQA